MHPDHDAPRDGPRDADRDGSPRPDPDLPPPAEPATPAPEVDPADESGRQTAATVRSVSRVEEAN